jgi:hypothetical protein
VWLRCIRASLERVSQQYWPDQPSPSTTSASSTTAVSVSRTTPPNGRCGVWRSEELNFRRFRRWRPSCRHHLYLTACCLSPWRQIIAPAWGARRMRTIVMVDFALVAGALRSPCRDRRAIRTLPASFVSPNGIGAGAILFRRQKGSERKPPRNIPLVPELFRNSSGQRKRAL